MLKNYLKIAWRNIWKSKQVSAVNIIGMSVAIAAALLLCFTVYSEFSYDNFHLNKKNLYQLYYSEARAEGPRTHLSTPIPLAPAMKEEMPGVVNIVRVANDAAGIRTTAGEVQTIGINCVDSSFLRMFTFPAVSGHLRLGLNDAIITEGTAAKLFKKEDPVGKTVSINQGDGWQAFTISAVVKDIPDNSSINFDVLLRLERVTDYAGNKDEWGHSNLYTFAQLTPGVTGEEMEKRSIALTKKYYEEDVDKYKKAGAKADKYGAYMHIGFIPMEEVHLTENGQKNTGRVMMLYMLLFIAAFLLFIASINFINLSMARAFTRAKEVGMRKALGAAKFQLALQLSGEAMVLFFFSLVLGIGLAYIAMPTYNAVLRYHLSFGILKDPGVITGMAIVFLLISILAGGYPALVLARAKTLQVLKGKINSGRNNYFRNSLIVTQFVFSSLLICCTIIAWQQMNFLKNKSLGFNTHEVVSIPVSNEVDAGQVLERMKAKLAQQPGILSISAARSNFGRGRDGSISTSVVGFSYKNQELMTNLQFVSYDYLKTMDIKLLAGREFSPQMADSNSIIINERMALQLGVKDIEGFTVRFEEDGPAYSVIGIMKDYHFQSLHRKIEPLTLSLNNEGRPSDYIFIRTAPGNLEASMATIESAWKASAPGAFLGSFVDENTARLYTGDKVLAKIFISGAVITIIISCMGLFAIALITIGQRNKEIGIRKVLGAGVVTITALISRDFLKLVILAILIATPIAWFVMNKWLGIYAYSIDINWWVFLLAGLLAISIAAITVGFQTIRAALMNPVKALRSE
ncbi:ABC transporter permease [Chitinophaga niabensis]|uniref:ABC-type transport system, involved in lipoprotein release, permease component n=1 Tax=Chitinophaga niabensis TaxID=536979 RepID=A0A1N6JHG1_9BACT|nr:ABC transporter permease [Chitinophaga niabensis]SIO43611.1 ABC-type transport system, involved in lipoprotein release, permease component [Chitinophaga niabensis]